MRYTAMLKRSLIILLGSFVLAFGLYHIHSLSGVTEGGQLGLTLLLHYWFDLSPALGFQKTSSGRQLFFWHLTLKHFYLFYWTFDILFSCKYSGNWPNDEKIKKGFRKKNIF